MFYRLFRWLFGSRDVVYRYHDGKRRREADPLVIGRELESLCPDYSTHLELLASEPPVPGMLRDDLERQRKEALQTLVDVSRQLFGIPTLAEGGRTDAAAFAVLVRWLVEMNAMGEAARPFVTSQPRDSPLTQHDSPSVS